MSLRYGLLGLLSEWEASGYDIKKEFDDLMSIFWHSHLSQIYPELSKLEEEALITSTHVPQEGKPDKKIYTITAKGKTALMKWLLTPPETPKLKDPFLMQTFFMDNIPYEEALLKLKIYKNERMQRLTKMKQIVEERWASIKERNVMSARILIGSTVLKRGIEQEVQYIKWCEDTITLIETCKFLWDKNNQAQSQSYLFTDVEDIFEQYFAE
ncbi:PadR family transcriptional regulator [Paenibacillus sp. N1-5-1-14]|uniref:PadR family transcriptional regulator n=1 Tax=Paenibacillus radicibacter TaxID=2972488 RepID=UPI002158D80F|nr:PadR family transcriptional regulator [Paenibacillus radicibacter]MCR8644247.1 PadR family transcriptional regulator [Paenibacillus radicibacter]